jgi:hypothetical protein
MLSKDEEIFLNRMVPHMAAGKSLEDAGRAVLEDDERLWLAAVANDGVGEEIRSQLAGEVYRRLRQKEKEK